MMEFKVELTLSELDNKEIFGLINDCLCVLKGREMIIPKPISKGRGRPKGSLGSHNKNYEDITKGE